MFVCDTLAALRSWRAALDPKLVVGFVPTLGALHSAHASLIEAARRDCDRVAVSVFVNPTQFGPTEDFARYPRDRKGDSALAEAAGADFVWFGDAGEMYPPGFATRVEVPDLARGLCGRSRPQHFGGVALVVLKLLNLFQPHRAYFGRKDYQQLRIVTQMVRDLALPVTIVPCPIVREPSGLALSSRNLRLSADGRSTATVISRALTSAHDLYAAGERRAAALTMAATRVLLDEPRFQIEYVELVDATSLAAVESVGDGAVLAVAGRVEDVRLIDNLLLDASAVTRDSTDV
ncbi:MAG: pantoate--beta-alanine ligase [Planctomycetota bacterium]